ncbi:4Fe-4S ferredoxin [Oceanidesulfovibrio indonesiensis]|uniref:4Fe-4S ferredoxin n=1 Tax=Oceanidesulfovibrio indonesiensis TaxID=54767 RepID=A0A7M3MG77_9BACT|nr:4Fe-4S dicluster domain-containing protein [Oceanidesulfovibrio indonesiensis]TVM17872.1 4Fe-4S ferredoxin [Oceanidesulfovibrio indonesiensis]
MAELNELREAVAKVLPDVKHVIGWQRGYHAVRSSPLFIRNQEDLDKLIWDRTCYQNLASYLTSTRGERVGIIVKGCDSRSVNQLLQEQLINREDVVVIGVPCTGVISLDKIRAKFPINRVKDMQVEGDELTIATRDGEEHKLNRWDVAPDKCLACKYPNPLIFDTHVGEPIETWEPKQGLYARDEEFDQKSLDERFEFWRREMSRCIRCYACRNACPMCVCRDHCIAESRQPHYQSQEADVREKFFFQLIHAMHLAGRCTECGECERACPMDIPVLLFKTRMGKVVKDLFDYEAGVDQTAVPPLLTFQAEESNIEEKEW